MTSTPRLFAHLALVASLATACPSKEPPPPATPPAPPKADVKAPPPKPPGLPAPADVAAPPADAAKTESGLATKVIAAGTGTEKPGPEDTVTVHYTGWTTDGNMFDSSVTRGQPAKFPLNRVIPGWSETVQLMVKGEKRRAWIPDTLAYKGRLGPQGTLVFDIELIEITAAPKPIPAPTDVAAAPKNAEVTKSGLASRVVKKGEGKVKPTATSTVEVHYTGWTTDGKVFDSSVMRGQPAQFPLNGVIPGWTEGVQLMVEGETRRFWIPGKLAYGEKPADGAPAQGGPPLGTLVFDVELLKIVR